MSDPNQLQSAVTGLAKLLTVEPDGDDRFFGRATPPGTGVGNGRSYGGMVMGQSLAAAEQTVPDDRAAHSIHVSFLRPGKDTLPITYRVERDFDGRSFSSRRVVAIQEDRPILTMTASFHITEQGLAHQVPMPDVPPPEQLEDDRLQLAERMRRAGVTWHDPYAVQRPLEMRSVGGVEWLDGTSESAVSHSWVRTVAPLEGGPHIHRAVLAFASDMTPMNTALMPHDVAFYKGDIAGASLDHALWFHDSFRMDDWLLISTESPWSGGARGFSQARAFTRDGRLVASFAQEGLIRLTGAKG